MAFKFNKLVKIVVDEILIFDEMICYSIVYTGYDHYDHYIILKFDESQKILTIYQIKNLISNICITVYWP